MGGVVLAPWGSEGRRERGGTGVATRTARAKGHRSPGGLGAGEGLPPWVWTRLSGCCVEDGQEGRGRERREAGRGAAEVRPWRLSKEEPQQCTRPAVGSESPRSGPAPGWELSCSAGAGAGAAGLAQRAEGLAFRCCPLRSEEIRTWRLMALYSF